MPIPIAAWALFAIGAGTLALVLDHLKGGTNDAKHSKHRHRGSGGNHAGKRGGDGGQHHRTGGVANDRVEPSNVGDGSGRKPSDNRGSQRQPATRGNSKSGVTDGPEAEAAPAPDKIGEISEAEPGPEAEPVEPKKRGRPRKSEAEKG